MIDLSQITEKISTVSELTNGFEGLGGLENVQQMLNDAGIDPSALSGMSVDEIAQTLEANGIDISQFTDGQLGELAQQFLGEAGANGEAGVDIGGIVGDAIGRLFSR